MAAIPSAFCDLKTLVFCTGFSGYIPVECGTGARTKKQRIEHKFSKEHYHDACCVGASTPKNIIIRQRYVQIWSAVGRGNRKMCNTDKYGFPISHRSRKKLHFGFQTGDLVVASIPTWSFNRMVNGYILYTTARPFSSNCLARFSEQGIKGCLCLSKTNTIIHTLLSESPVRGL